MSGDLGMTSPNDRRRADVSDRHGTLERWTRFPGAGAAAVGEREGDPEMKTIMGWIDKIVSSLARRKVNKDEGRPGR